MNTLYQVLIYYKYLYMSRGGIIFNVNRLTITFTFNIYTCNICNILKC